MFKKFYPYAYVDSVFDIDYEKLYEKGFRGIVFDIDNTLVHHGDDSTPEIDALFEKIHKTGLKTLLLSNNSEARIRRFIKNIDTPYIYDAKKPETEGYYKAAKLLGLGKDEIIFAGDQIFTDILGANRCGFANILVKFICVDENAPIGKRRHAENIILKFYRRNKKYRDRLGDITVGRKIMQSSKHKNFCDINPFFYTLALKKGIFVRHIKDMTGSEKFAKTRYKKKLPVVVARHSSHLIKKGKGIDPVLQHNKADNIDIAARTMNGMIIRPGETFSFWKTVGKITAKKGYKDGRVIFQNKIKAGKGGGLCNLANTLNLLILHSPLTITEFHTHSDALAPDAGGVRVPLSAGTSVSYNYIDYRFKNNTKQNFQLCIWCENEELKAELRSEAKVPYSYEITEEDHHFHKEGDKYYRISKIYRNTIDKATGKNVEKKLIWDNHSMVMFDEDLIPEDLIR